MKYAVDRIEDTTVIIENIETKEKEEISITDIVGQVHEGSIIIKQDNIYVCDIEEEEARRKKLREKLERLKNLKDKA